MFPLATADRLPMESDDDRSSAGLPFPPLPQVAPEGPSRSAAERGQLQALLDCLPDLVWLIDAEGRFLAANEPFSRLVGLLVTAIPGRRAEDVLPPGLRERSIRADRSALQTGVPVRRDEIILPTGSLERCCFETTTVPVRGPDGTMTGTVGIARDVTASRLFEEELTGARDYYYAGINAVGPCWTTNRDHRYTLVNREAAAFAGLAPTIAVGKTPAQLFPENEAAALTELQEEVFATGAPLTRELEVTDARGRKSIVLVRAFPDVGPSSEPLVVSLWTDVTEMRRLGRELAASEEFLDGILNAIPDPVFVKDRDHCWVAVNDAMCSFLGQTREGLLGRPDSEVFPPAQVEVIHVRDDDVLRTGLDNVNEEDLSVGNSEVRRVVTKKSLHVDREGRPLVVGVIRDVTKVRSDEAALRRANRNLEAANAELEAFAFSVSHDLSAPLRRIESFSEILLDDCRDRLDPADLELLRRIWSTARHAEQLIDDLLALSRASLAEMLRERIDLGILAREIADVLVEQQPGRLIDVEIAEGLVVDGDRRLLRLCLENLLGNALKFTRGRETLIEIGAVDAGPDRERAIFVRDNGVGFDMAYADRLFGVFQRLHRPGEFPGSGVGLALVKRIVHRHGGRVWAESAVEKGTTIFFTLG